VTANNGQESSVIKALRSADTKSRIETCLALEAIFSRPETDESYDQRNRLETQRKCFEALLRNGALPVFVDRLADADVHVRQAMASAVLAILVVGGQAAAVELRKGGIVLATVILLVRCLNEQVDEDMLCIVLSILREFVSQDDKSCVVFWQNDAAPYFVLLRIATQHNGRNAEDACTLVSMLLEESEEWKTHTNSARLIQKASIEASSQIRENWRQENLNSGARAALLLSATTVVCNSDDVEICLNCAQNLVHFAEKVLSVPGIDCETANILLETLTNVCTISENGVADLIVRTSSIVKRCVNLLQDPSVDLKTRACGLLDNLVQSCSDNVFDDFEPPKIWVAISDLLKSFPETMENPPLIESSTALTWSIVRRWPGSSNADGISNVLISMIENDTSSHQARTNAIGCLGCIGAKQDSLLTKTIAGALCKWIRDVSPLVIVQCMDSLIEIFADDAKDPLFKELNVIEVMKTSKSRLTAIAKANGPLVDQEFATQTLENCVNFISYKEQSDA